MAEEKVVRTACSPNCFQTCSLLATVRDGKLVKVAPAPLPDPEYSNRVCMKGLTHVQSVYSPFRLQYPMKRAGQRGEGKWQRITWDEALDTIAGRFQEIKEKFGSQHVGIFAGSGNYGVLNGVPIADKFSGLFGSVSVFQPFDMAVPSGYLSVFGGRHFWANVGNEPLDYVNARMIIVWGGSIGETKVQDIRFIFDAMEKGAKLVVIDPRFTTIAAKADTWVPLRPCSDIALALAMINVVIQEELIDKEFVINKTVAPFLVRRDTKMFLRGKDISGDSSDERYVVWDTVTDCARFHDEPGVCPELTGTHSVGGMECDTAFKLITDVAGEYPLQAAEQLTEIPAETIHKLAVDLATIKPGGILPGFGPDRYYEGIVLGQALATLLALTGNVGKSGTIQQGYSCAVPMNTVWRYPTGNRPTQTSIARLYDTDSKEPYHLKALYVTCSNMLNQLPNRRKWIEQMLPEIELFVVADLMQTNTVEYADIVLPAAHWFEEEDVVMSASMPYLLYRGKVIEPMGESKPDFEIWQELAQRLGFGQYFAGTAADQIQQFLDAPRYRERGVTFEGLKEVGGARLFPKPYIAYQKFPTSSGRAEFYVEKWAQFGRELPRHRWPLEAGPDNPLAATYPLILNSQHGRWRIHSQFANMPWIQELNPEPTCEINPVDAQARDIKEGDVVEVFNDRGRLVLQAKLTEALRPGVVNIQQGWWPRHYKNGHHQELTHGKVNPLLDNFNVHDVRVQVGKVL